MTARRGAVLWPWIVLVLLLGSTGCRHKVAVVPPPPPAKAPAVTPPAGPPAPITVITPLPSVPPPAPEVKKEAPTPPPTAQKPQATPHKHHFHHKAAENPDEATAATNSSSANAPAASDSTEKPTAPSVAGTPAGPANGSPAQELPALGELSTGANISGKQRQQLLDEIGVQEKRLKKQPAPTTPERSALLAQVEAFLAKAREAVAQNDLDGARTLKMKATVLLDELEGQ